LSVQEALAIERPLAADPNPFAYDSCRFRRFHSEEFIDTRSTDQNAHVESIEKRAAETTSILRQCCLVALARPGSATTTRTRVRRADEDEPSRQHGSSMRTRDAHHSLFERLTQSIEGRGRELTEFVEEKNSTMSEADLTRTHR
jgi:hypothetical protein